MSATIHNFPPRLRLIEAGQNVRPADDLDATAKHLRHAMVHLEIAEVITNGEAFDRMIADIEAALFFALTHRGCQEADRSFRNELLRRHDLREADRA